MKRSVYLIPLVPVIWFLFVTPCHAQLTAASVSTAAHAKYDAGDLDQAKPLFAQLIEEFPSSTLASDAQYYLGWIAHKKNTGEA
ncbi:MAG: tetratricopeptide repeat protein, partial [Armatimonadetes bacterium]|nr:tetratricopeptide repeat protein [Armatimonadota bacterium]